MTPAEALEFLVTWAYGGADEAVAFSRLSLEIQEAERVLLAVIDKAKAAPDAS